MPLPLANRTIALAEGRQLEELATLLEKEGAVPLRCSMLNILDAPDEVPVIAWLDQLCAGGFHWVVLLTGEGLRRLLACADRHGRRDAVVAALAKANTITRGPKPARALKEINLAPTLSAQAPTTEGVIATLRSVNLRGSTIGVQLYSEANPPLVDFLREAGATPKVVQPYVYAPAADSEQVADLYQKMAAGEVSAIVFTSSPQIDRLFEVAESRQQIDLLRDGLGKSLVAAVGPIVEENLRKRGIAVQVCPEQGFVMKNLIQHLKKAMTG
ncbi:MAG: uroporphyrinogen-III synthase [Planctomycetes bacterium]|nr:uroporphyrinogen-III synthase [Planctomycetota bacterium]